MTLEDEMIMVAEILVEVDVVCATDVVCVACVPADSVGRGGQPRLERELANCRMIILAITCQQDRIKPVSEEGTFWENCARKSSLHLHNQAAAKVLLPSQCTNTYGPLAFPIQL